MKEALKMKEQKMQQEREEHIGQHKIDCGLAADHCFQG